MKLAGYAERYFKVLGIERTEDQVKQLADELNAAVSDSGKPVPTMPWDALTSDSDLRQYVEHQARLLNWVKEEEGPNGENIPKSTAD